MTTLSERDRLRALIMTLEPELQEVWAETPRRDLTYSRLQHGDVRLLDLDNDDLDKPLSGKLDTCSLASADFTAVSYAWGSDLKPKSLRIGSREELSISLSAHQALRRLRSLSPIKSKVWIDSVCINQNDNTEKASQVSMMGQIYHHASHVLVWLGEAEESDAMAFWTCRHLAQTWDKYRHMTELSENTKWSYLNAHLARSALMPEHFDGMCHCCSVPCHWRLSRHNHDANITTLMTEAIASVQNLLDRAYFRRLWPVQEVWMARHCTLYCGSHHISFDDLCHAVALVSALQGSMISKVRLLNMQRYYGQTDAGATTDSTQSVALLSLLRTTRHLDVKDPRDRIYAVRALMHPSASSQLMPDYHMPLIQLWIDVAFKLVSGVIPLGPMKVDNTGREHTVVHPSIVLALAAAQQESTAWRSAYISETISLDPLELDRHAELVEAMTLPRWAPYLHGIGPDIWQNMQSFLNSHLFKAGGETPYTVYLDPGSQNCIRIRVIKIATINDLTSASTDAGSVLATFPHNTQDENSAKDVELIRAFRRWQRCFEFITRSSSVAEAMHRKTADPDTTIASQIARILCQGLMDVDSKEFVPENRPLLDSLLLKLAERPRWPQPRRRRGRARTSNDSIKKTVWSDTYARVAQTTLEMSFMRFRRSDPSRELVSFKDDRFGWAGPLCRAGDELYLLAGTPLPFYFRRTNDGTYRNLGSGYIDEFMDGEGWDEAKAEWITLC